MAKNVDHIQHVKSSVVLEENGVFSPKLPNPSVLADGEIAVNYAKGYETLSIKNNSGDVVTFSSDNKFYTKDFIDEKLGSGFTGENSANTVTKVIEDNELTISSALNDLNQRKLDASAYTPTDLSNYYTKSETSGATQIATALNGKADASDIMQSDWSQTATTENDYINNKPNIVTNQNNDTTIDGRNVEITSDASMGGVSIDGSWIDLNAGGLNLEGSGGNIDFASGPDTDELKIRGFEGVFIEADNNTNVKLTTSGTGKAYYNNKEIAVKDDVPTVSGYADSVKYNSTSHAIEFYHGTTAGTKVFEVDASAFIIDGMVENVEIDDVTSGSSTVKCLVVSFNTDAGKQDINIPISEIFDPSIYYTKEEIDNAELTISSALNDLNERKLDASAYTPTDLSNYYTKSETSGASQITTALNSKADVSDFNTHTADTSIHLTSGDVQTQIDDSISGKVNVSDVVSAITSLNSGSTNPVSTIAIMTVVADNEEVVSSALNDLNERKLDASAYTPTDLSDYYTKSETSGATQIATALADKVNVSDVVSAITPSNSGSTTNPVSVKVVAENEMVMASALNDLNENKLDVTAYTPTDLSNYYTKSETSASTEIASEFSKLGETVHNVTNVTGAVGGTNLCASWSGECEEITELYDGLNIQIKLPNSGHTSGCTISINGGEKHKVILNATTNLTTQYASGSIVRFVYDANQSGAIYTGSSTTTSVTGVWKVSDYNTNTTYTVMPYVYLQNRRYYAGEKINRYMILLSKNESTLIPINTNDNVSAGTKTLTTEEFNPFGPILYYSVTASTASGATIASGRTYQQYNVNLAYSFNTTNTLTPYRDVYMVAVPQSNGMAKLAPNPITQTLPTTDDGLIYIYLGCAYSNTTIAFTLDHPIYQYKDGQIRLYTNSSASVVVDQTIDSGTSASTNAVATQAVYNTIKDTELVWTNAYNALSGVVSSHSSSYVTSMGGYTKPSTTSAISTSDTLNQAVGKLECALGGIRLQSISQSDYDSLVTKDPNTLYIITS